MATLPTTPYHIAEQNASALLGPIAADLAAIANRLSVYRDRLHMPDGDRAAIARAGEAIERARAEIATLAARR